MAGGAAAVVKEIVNPLLVAGVNRFRERHAEQAWQIACEQSGLDSQTLADRLARSASTLYLAAEAVQAAELTPLPEKVAVFGLVIANAARDDAKVDEEQMIVAVLAKLDAPHIQVLKLLSTESPKLRMQGYDVSQPGWPAAEVREALPGHAVMLDPILSALTSHGLVEQTEAPARIVAPGEIGPLGFVDRHRSWWRPTEFGQLCVERLDAAAALVGKVDS